jgi:hypothetical protein
VHPVKYCYQEALVKRTTREILQGGFFSGAIGYATVSLFHAVLNVLGGRPPWSTLEAMGNALFAGGGPGPLIAYNGIHLALFLLIGLIASLLVEELELHPGFWYVIFFMLVTGFVVGFALSVVLTGSIAHVNALSVAAGNLLAALAMGTYLYLSHPRLAGILRTLDTNA